MKQFFLYIITLLAVTFSPVTVRGASPDTILKKTIDNIAKAPSVTFNFSAIESGGGSTAGALIMSGKKFMYDTKPLKSWFDGKTQYTLVTSNKEVNISEPTAEEILETNPLSLIMGYAKNYTAKTVSNSSGICTIRLTPKTKKQPIKSAEVTINTRTYMPMIVMADFGGKRKATITINSVKTGPALPASTFTFSKKEFPGVSVVDLR